MENNHFQSTNKACQDEQHHKTGTPMAPSTNPGSPAKQSNTSIECRICLQSNDLQKSQLISPCNCTGSVKYIHISCFKTWIHKKYEDPQIREQITNQVGLACQICKEKYQFTYNVEKQCTRISTFYKKIKQNKYFLIGNILFVIIAIILLAIASKYAHQDIMSPDFDLRQPRYFLSFIAIILACGSFLYGLYEFISFFLFQSKLVLFPSNKEIKAQAPKQAKHNTQSKEQQETKIRMIEPNRLIAQ